MRKEMDAPGTQKRPGLSCRLGGKLKTEGGTYADRFQ